VSSSCKAISRRAQVLEHGKPADVGAANGKKTSEKFLELLNVKVLAIKADTAFLLPKTILLI
jgi:hypothetical protein